MNPETLLTLALIVACGLIHASYQLSVSVLTLLSGHAIGKKTHFKRVLRLSGSYLLGTIIMTLLLITSAVYTTLHIFSHSGIPLLAWAIVCGLLIGLGIATWVFYYRKSTGTSLWLPRSMAQFLTKRAKTTRDPAEAFSLGLSTVIAEILFIAGPLAAAALLIPLLPSTGWQLVGILVYTLSASLSLGIVWILVGSGHSLSRIQLWREKNKRFLQFSGGSLLVLLGFYLYTEKILFAKAVLLGGI
ncbi:hypothetical protein FJZ39_04500 [Candidatus Saccharibacteria bacterium]|nr:hypothetical protein [Candidatus Saccharibacteria bacterium]